MKNMKKYEEMTPFRNRSDHAWILWMGQLFQKLKKYDKKMPFFIYFL